MIDLIRIRIKFNYIWIVYYLFSISSNGIIMADPPDPLHLTNVVGNAANNYSLDIIEITEDFQGRFGESVFPACNSICKESGTTNSIFKSGQIVVTGAKSNHQCLLGVLYTVKKIRDDFDINLKYYNFNVNNIVASCKLGYQINRDLFYSKNKQCCNWDPESFVGLCWRTLNPTITFVAFENGAVVATGLESVDALPIIVERLQMLKPFELGKEYTKLTIEEQRTRYAKEDANQVEQSKQLQLKNKFIGNRNIQAENYAKYLELQSLQDQYMKERQKKGIEDEFDKEQKRLNKRKRKIFNVDATDPKSIEDNKRLMLNNPGFYSKKIEQSMVASKAPIIKQVNSVDDPFSLDSLLELGQMALSMGIPSIDKVKLKIKRLEGPITNKSIHRRTA